MRSVDCAALRDAFRAGDLPAGPEVEAHLDACPACRELFSDEARVGRALGELPAPAALGPELWARTERRLLADTGARAWLRSRPTWQRAALALLAGALLAAGALRRPAVAPLVAMDPVAWVQLVLYAALTVAGIHALLRPLARPAPRGLVRAALVGAAVLLPVIFAFPTPGSVHGAHVLSEGELARRTLGCLLYGLALGLPFLGVLWLLDRSERLGLSALVVLAVASGLLANLALALHCPLDERAHLLLGHAPVGVALALGVFAARALSRRRPRGTGDLELGP